MTRSARGYLTGAWGLFITTGAAQRHNPPHAAAAGTNISFPSVTQKPPNFKTFSRKNGYELGARIEAGFLTKCEVYVAVLTLKKY